MSLNRLSLEIGILGQKLVESTGDIIGAYSTLQFCVVGFLKLKSCFVQACLTSDDRWLLLCCIGNNSYSTVHNTYVLIDIIIGKVKACCQMITRNICLCLKDTAGHQTLKIGTFTAGLPLLIHRRIACR